MGRTSRLRQQRRQAARFTVLSPGILEVLSVGKGDLKIEIGDSNEDRAKAQDLITEMLRKGYTLFVEQDDGPPLKVTRFLPDQMAYVVVDTPDIVPAEPTPAAAGPGLSEPDNAPGADSSRTLEDSANGPLPVPAKRPRKPRTVPVAGSKTTAIGRTAGG